jgi:hypothetical protein
VAALQHAWIDEQRRDLARGVLVDTVETNEGIGHQQARERTARSSRTVGAVISWTSRSASVVPTAAQMLSNRGRTMCSASSAA